MTIETQLKALLRSRKFWALLTTLATTAAAFASGQIDAWQAVLAVLVATQTYSVATAYEDGNKPL